MKKIGQIYTHQIIMTEADQCLLHDEIMRAKDVKSRLAAQTNGWSSRKYALDEYTTYRLMAMYAYIVADLLSDVAGKKKPVRFWFVGLEQGGQVMMHNHHQSDWSAVLYPHGVDCDDGGQIMFEDGVTVRPRAGLVVLFPGTLRHKIRTYKGSTARLSVAFNRDVDGG